MSRKLKIVLLSMMRTVKTQIREGVPQRALQRDLLRYSNPLKDVVGSTLSQRSNYRALPKVNNQWIPQEAWWSTNFNQVKDTRPLSPIHRPKLIAKRVVPARDSLYLKYDGVKIVSAWQSGGHFDLERLFMFGAEQHWQPRAIGPGGIIKSASHDDPLSKENCWVIHFQVPNNLEKNRDYGHIFCFTSGAIVTWNFRGSIRAKIDELLMPYHTHEGFPGVIPFKRSFMEHIENKLDPHRLNLEYLDTKRFQKITREDFNLDWQFTMNPNQPGKAVWTGTFREILNWDEEKVCEWLNSVKLGDLTKTFSEHKITGEHLLTLTDEDISELCAPIGTRKWLVQELQILKTNEVICERTSQILIVDFEDVDKLLAISFALAQAAQLDVVNHAIEWVSGAVKNMTIQQSKRGRTLGTHLIISHLLGQHQLLRHILEDEKVQPPISSEPDFFWERSDIEHLYNSTIEHLGHTEKAQRANEKWEFIKEAIIVERTYRTEKTGHRLEWIIIIILLFEVLREIPNKQILSSLGGNEEKDEGENVESKKL